MTTQNTSYTPDPKFDYSQIIGTIAKIGKNLNRSKVMPSQNYSPASSNMPVPTSLRNLGSITTPYGGRTKYEAVHPGVDIGGTYNAPIPTYQGGKVAEVVTGKRQGDKGYGNYVVVIDNQGNRWRYSHLAQEYVKVGDTVTPGQVLGGMGNSGQTYSASGRVGPTAGTHLDLRIVSAAGKYLNPLSYIKG